MTDSHVQQTKIPINRIHLDLGPDPRMVMAKFFFNGEERSREIIRKILRLDEESVKAKLRMVNKKYADRHRNFSSTILNHYKNIRYLADDEAIKLNLPVPLPMDVQSLIGSYFTMEYSISAGALFNPSIVPAPPPAIVNSNRLDFVMSLRATGEGHISSIIFRTGHYLADLDRVILDEPSLPIKTPTQQRLFNYEKENFNKQIKAMGVQDYFRKSFMECIEDHVFSYQDFQIALRKFEQQKKNIDERDEKFWFNKIKWLADSHLELIYQDTNVISERVIFPITEQEKNGIEDARFALFNDEDGPIYYATYTAYDGRIIMPKLISTRNFKEFEIRPLQGKKAQQKNFALFPRKVNGKYSMLSRIDGHNHYLMYSDNILKWDNAEKIEIDRHFWELIQVGNCGSPIETEAGWLVITHGVGAMREYCLGAMLLDLDNPLKVIAALPYPLMMPGEDEREGYVPNVLYSCGATLFKEKLLLPYACSDTRINFATIPLQPLLKEMLRHKS